MNGKKLRYEHLWYLSIFAFCYLWFAHIHPLVVFDADDWTYIAYVRKAMPVWGEWNPSRVFPEVFMPLVSSVAVFLLRPFGVGYMTALTAGNALVVSACITVYVFCFGQLMKRLFALGNLEAGYASALFLLLHFLVFRSRDFGNTYLFYCVNVTCYYYYLIPELISAALVMSMVKNPSFDAFLEMGSPGKKGLFFLAVYLMIFSNLPASGILAVYAGARALLALLRQLKSFRLKAYVRENGLYLLILGGWLFSAVFELSGGRADSMGAESNPLISGLVEALFVFKDTIFNCNRLFLVLCVGLFAVAAMLFLLTKKKETVDQTFLEQSIVWILSAGVMLLYTMILSAKVQVGYMARSEYLFGVFFFGLLLVLVSASYLMARKPKLLAVVPIALCILFFEINLPGNTFQEATMQYVDPGVCVQISNDLVEQALAAEKAGQSEMELYVPDWKNEDNWPHAVQLMDRMSQALVEHGVLREPIRMHIIPSADMNEKFGLLVPDAVQ